MHAGVRSATELLQQEVGQAGRISLPVHDDARRAAVAVGDADGRRESAGGGAAGAAVAGVSGIFDRRAAHVDAGANQETVAVTAVNTGGKTITATFTLAHAAGAPIMVLGGFANGVVPLVARVYERIDAERAEAVRRHQRRRQHGVRRVHRATRPAGICTATSWRSMRRPKRRRRAARSFWETFSPIPTAPAASRTSRIRLPVVGAATRTCWTSPSR